MVSEKKGKGLSDLWIPPYHCPFSSPSPHLRLALPRYRVVLPDHPDDWVFGTGRSDNYSGLVGMVALQVSGAGGGGGGGSGGAGGDGDDASGVVVVVIVVMMA